MSENVEGKITYVAFEVKRNVFAIPINETLGIMQLTRNIPQTILPGAANYVKCIVEVDGMLIPIINMLGSDGDMRASGDLVVVLECTNHHIGISADEVYFVAISENEIMEDTITGTRTFVRGGKNYYILDECQLYKYLNI